jgi:dTDP-4-dehydrorhamnose 3,5-epimerase
MRHSSGGDMRFEPLAIPGAMLVSQDRNSDQRGYFARSFCAREFLAHGLNATLVQSSVSFNEKRGTVRGLHFQWPPSQEDKLVRCTRGRLFDVLLDLRPHSSHYLQHVAVTLDEVNGDAVFIPQGVAHGFQTLTNQTEVLYAMSDYYAPNLATGMRWNDVAFGIAWPMEASEISAADATRDAFDRVVFEQQLSMCVSS